MVVMSASVARRWAQLRYSSLIDALPCSFGCTLETTIGDSSQRSRVDVATSNQELLDAVRLSCFDFCTPLQPENRSTFSGAAPSVAHSTVRISDTLPRGIGAPSFLNEPIQHARRQQLRGMSDPKVNTEKWNFGTLLDGFVAQQVKDHNVQLIRDTIERGEFVRQDLTPLSRSPFVAASDDQQQWSVFGGDPWSESSLNDALDVIDRAMCSQTMRSAHETPHWISADAIVHKKSGKVVLFLGPPRCGKTTLAMLCLHTYPDVALVDCGSILLSCTPSHHNSAVVAAASLSSPRVKIGTVFGALAPNPSLQSMLSQTHPQLLDTLLANGNDAIWRLEKSLRCNVAEQFGIGRRVPFPSTSLTDVVVLNWDTTDLTGGACYARQCTEMQDVVSTTLSADVGGSLFESDTLVEAGISLGDAIKRRKSLESFIRRSWNVGLNVTEVKGSVSFPKACRLVGHLLQSNSL